jgi:carboxypeptidase C (cathepsin A)
LPAVPALLLAAVLAAPAALRAQDAHDSTTAPAPAHWKTHHSIVVDGQTIDYDAVVGSIILRDHDQKPIAEIYYTSYTRTGVKDESKRPILFAYNGGPGSSSFWLHMGIMGPRRVVTSTTEHMPPAPYKVVDNQYTLLDRTDIVMVDPVGTGFSHPLGDASGSQFWGVDEDARSLTQFIQRFLSQSDRWNSPKYLLGESYGTMRSAMLASTLQRANIDLNGVVLLSTVLNLRTLIFSPGDDLAYVVNLPSYAAVAWYHHALPGPQPAELEPFLRKVESFAMGEYATDLLKGGALDSIERDHVLGQLHDYTGLSRTFLSDANLRVTAPEFEKELLKEKGEVLGRLDARFTGPTGDLLQRTPTQDPQSSAIGSAYAAAWNSYLRDDLGYKGKREYVLSGNVNPWDWKHGSNIDFGQSGFTNVGPDLASAMERNPKLQILLLCGLYDLATPYFAASWTMDHLGLPPDLRKNIQRVDFASGHMVYVNPDVLPKWKETLDAFIDRTSGQ